MDASINRTVQARVPFELYIHVPFCLKRCGYCDFNTYTATDMGGGASRSNYANLAIAEMRLVHDWQQIHGIEEPALSSIFFGGGTPTILPAADLIRMVKAAEELWGLEYGAEVTTEANPDTVDEQYLAQLADGGFTRISFGMQSAVPHVLATLDRTHTPENVTTNVRAAQRQGLRSSVDLIYGTPGESLDDWQRSVQAALDLEVQHISAYALTLEPTTKMGRQVTRGQLKGPDDDDEAAKYELVDDMLTQAGLRWYEISNWACPGQESRHNVGYWRNIDWAGIGPGAHSHYNRVAFAVENELIRGSSKQTIWRTTSQAQDSEQSSTQTSASAYTPLAALTKPSPEFCSIAPMRAWDIAHPKVWAQAVQAGEVPWGGGEAITLVEDIEETVMLGLRLREGLSLKQLSAVSGHVWAEADFVPAVSHDLALVSGGRIVATRKGRLLNDDLIAQVLDLVTNGV